jgi:hypothetical protein
VRRLILGLVYKEALSGGFVTMETATAHVKARMKDGTVDPSAVEAALHEIAAEFDADVSSAVSTSLRFTFPTIRSQFVASETVRRRLKLEEGKLGEVVYSSADSNAEASDREGAAFDREFAAKLDLTAYLPSPDRAGFEDEYELVAFDEELKRRGEGTVGLKRR